LDARLAQVEAAVAVAQEAIASRSRVKRLEVSAR
jgi:hypothetical protein